MTTPALQVAPFPASIIVPARSTAWHVVRLAESWLMANGNTHIPPHGAHKIHLVQSLPYLVGTYRDIWSPGYPTAQQAAAIIEESWGVKVEFTDDGPTCLASEAQP
ncbi:MAG: hypothetical protein E6R03_00805 [Hyphomicrobiaceae bacterium]|nr:MAG: hypothetical protein E6R03_00805 [Hyphomicrobiaceae bacterium]